MLREEAEHEAERRNAEDPDRERFEFYPFDESAGLAADAWDVAARLRQGPRADRPATAAAAARRATAVEEAVAYEEPAAVYEEPAVYEQPAAVYEQPPVYEDPSYSEYAEAYPAEAYEAPARRRLRLPRRKPREERAEDAPGLFVRTVGAVVVVVGLLWMALVVALALLLSPEDATSFAVYIAGAVLGLLAIALGAAIRRS